MHESERQEIINVGIALDRYRLISLSGGNVSMRIGDHILVTPSGMSYETLVPQDVVVMDIGMPALNGIEATRQIRKDLPKTRVVALSMHTDEKYVAEMLRAGAVGYLCKKCEADELVQAIRIVAAGQTYLSPSISGNLVETYVRNAAADSVSAFSLLTDREREILQLLAEEKSVKEIAAQLNLSLKTVHAHREHLMKKLNVQTMAGLTKYAVREGLTEI